MKFHQHRHSLGVSVRVWRTFGSGICFVHKINFRILVHLVRRNCVCVVWGRRFGEIAKAIDNEGQPEPDESRRTAAAPKVISRSFNND